MDFYTPQNRTQNIGTSPNPQKLQIMVNCGASLMQPLGCGSPRKAMVISASNHNACAVTVDSCSAFLEKPTFCFCSCFVQLCIAQVLRILVFQCQWTGVSSLVVERNQRRNLCIGRLRYKRTDISASFHSSTSLLWETFS